MIAPKPLTFVSPCYNVVVLKASRQKKMEPATIMGIVIVAILLLLTAISIYTAFGPPSAQLTDPFEEHED